MPHGSAMAVYQRPSYPQNQGFHPDPKHRRKCTTTGPLTKYPIASAPGGSTKTCQKKLVNVYVAKEDPSDPFSPLRP